MGCVAERSFCSNMSAVSSVPQNKSSSETNATQHRAGSSENGTSHRRLAGDPDIRCHDTRKHRYINIAIVAIMVGAIAF
jgi:hypothetical protein